MRFLVHIAVTVIMLSYKPILLFYYCYCYCNIFILICATININIFHQACCRHCLNRVDVEKLIAAQGKTTNCGLKPMIESVVSISIVIYRYMHIIVVVCISFIDTYWHHATSQYYVIYNSPYSMTLLTFNILELNICSQGSNCWCF